MPSRFARAGALFFFFLAALSAAQAEQANPETVQPPAAGVALADWEKFVRDFQGGDKALQETAEKVFFEGGSRGYNEMARFVESPDAGIAARAKKLREKIDAHSWQMYQDVMAQQNALTKVPIDAPALEKLTRAWIDMANYSPQTVLKQTGLQQASETQKAIKRAAATNQQLADCDAELKAVPADKAIVRAGLQLQRAGFLKSLQRFAEAVAAAREAQEAGGAPFRFRAPALKLQAEVHLKIDDAKSAEEACRRIATECPRSLEVKFAHETLIELMKSQSRWDDAVKQCQKFFEAFPIDESSENELFGLVETLMQDEHDFKRVMEVTEWIMANLPPERIAADIPKLLGGCNEYVAKNYSKAEQHYRMLAERFPDAISADDMAVVMQRLKLKADGKFPKEPQAGDADPAGAFARFLLAIRTRDAKAIAELVPEDEADGYVDLLESGDEMITGITFADFAVKKISADEKNESAELEIDYFDAAAVKPHVLKQKAVKEKGKWKIAWRNPAEPAPAAP